MTTDLGTGTACRPNSGIFITFEGGDGVGKSTHVRILAEALQEHGYEVVCLREPGGTSISEQLRELVLDPSNDAMTPETELLIYEASRAQIVTEQIAPALARGAVVLCDRFTDSTVAYQAYGRGLSRDFVNQANTFACQGVYPHRTVVIAASGGFGEGLARVRHRGQGDRIEQAGNSFHERVSAAFIEMASDNPERMRVVVSAASKAKTAAEIFFQLQDLFPWMASLQEDDFVRFSVIAGSHSKETQVNALGNAELSVIESED